MPPRRMLLLCFLSSLGGALPAAGFVVEVPLSAAARWSAEPYRGTGLHDGIQVGIAAGIEAALGLAPEEIPPFRQAVLDAFAAWESSTLRFEVTFDAAAIRGEEPGEGFEIDVFALASDDPLFVGSELYGLASFSTDFTPGRLLTNGQRTDGETITGGDIYLNIGTILLFRDAFPLTPEQQAAALQRLLMHEIGHLLAIDHPGDGANVDSDTVPFNPIPVDPCDIESGLMYSPNVDGDTVMSNTTFDLDALTVTSLGPDELGARDVLYPEAPPGVACPPFPERPEPSVPGRVLLDSVEDPSVRSIRDLVVDPAGSLLVLHQDGVLRIDSEGRRQDLLDADTLETMLGTVLALGPGPDGGLFVTGIDDNVLRRAPDGAVQEILDASGDGRGNPLDLPGDIAADAEGNVYVASRNNHRVFRVDPAGDVEVVIGPDGAGDGAALQAPGHLVVDGRGNLYVAGVLSNNLLKRSPDGRIVQVLDSSGIGGMGFFRPSGLVADAADRIYALSNRAVVLGVDPDGSVEVVADFGGTLPPPLLPAGLALDALGNLSVFDMISMAGRRATAGGEMETLYDVDPGPLDPRVVLLAQVADARGTLYVLSRSGVRSRVTAVDPTCRAGIDTEPSLKRTSPELPFRGGLVLLEGTGFAPESRAFLGELPLTTFHPSSATLVAQLPDDAPGVGALRVVNPPTCTSQPLSVEVQPRPRCGVVGIEALLAVAAIRLRRRRRARPGLRAR